MRRPILVVVALAGGIALIAFAWPGEPPRATSSAPGRTAAAPRAPRPVIAEPGVPVESDEVAAIEHADAALQALGRACWERRVLRVTPPEKPDETTQSLRLELRVTVAAGEARAAVVAVTDDKLVDPALRGCILDGVTALRWQSDRPDGRAQLRTILRMGRFTVPQGPPTTPPPAHPMRIPLTSPPPTPGPPAR